MLASTLDEDGPGAPCGAARARGRWRARRGFGPVLGRLVVLAPALAGAFRAGALGGGRDLGRARLVARARSRGRDCTGAARGFRLLVRGLDPLVDRAGPLVGLPEPRAGLRRLRGGRARGRRVRAAGGSAVGVGARGRGGARPWVGAARKGDPVGGRLGTDRAAELARRLLERARAGVRLRAAAGVVARGSAGPSALGSRRGHRLPLWADDRAAAHVLARGDRGRRACRGGVA